MHCKFGKSIWVERPCACCGCNWVDLMSGGCVQDAGFQQAFGAIRVKFKPTAKDMQMAEESGTDLAQRVLKKLKAQQRKAQAGASQVSTGTHHPSFSDVHSF